MLTPIPGVEVVLSHPKRALDVQDDGYIGRIEGGTAISFLLSVNLGISPDVHAFTRDGAGNVRLMRDIGPDHDLSGDGSLYKAVVPVRLPDRSNGGSSYTKYPENSFRFVEYAGDGLVKIWRVALVSQMGEFFVVIEKYWEARLYRDGDAITCPFFSEQVITDKRPKPRWPQIVSLLAELYSDKFGEIRPVSEYVPEDDTPKADSLGEGVGIVHWWSAAQGMGGIVTETVKARVHWNEILERRPKRLFLVPGERVFYGELKEISGGSDYKFQAEGIIPFET